MTAPFCCPRCGYRVADAEAELSTKITDLRAWCERTGRWISPDGRVDESTAAQLVGRDVGTLRNWRALSDPPVPFRRSGAGRGRISYDLRAIATHLLRA